MYQSPQSTILKSKLTTLKTNDRTVNNFYSCKGQSDDKECFTPVFKTKNEHVKNDPLRNSDEIHSRNGQYHGEINNYLGTSKYYRQQIPRNPQNIGNEYQNKKQFQTPKKTSPSKNQIDFKDFNNQPEGHSNDYLVINTCFNSFNTPSDLKENQYLSPSDKQALKHQLIRSKRQGDKLKDENLKLRLQKVKLTNKNTKSDTFKLIPLKIQHQNLKKEIQKLLQQKQMLLLNKKIKQNSRNQPDLKINGTQFQVLKHIPGSVYSQKQIKCNSMEQHNDSVYKNYQSITSQKPSINSSFTISNVSIDSRNDPKLSNSFLTQSPTNKGQNDTSSSNQSIKNFISSNNQSIKRFFKLQITTIQCPQESNDQNVVNKQSQGLEKRRNNEQTSKSTFIRFAKQSLKSGQKPIFQNYDKNTDYRLSRQRQNNISAVCLNRTFDNILSRQDQANQRLQK